MFFGILIGNRSATAETIELYDYFIEIYNIMLQYYGNVGDMG